MQIKNNKILKPKIGTVFIYKNNSHIIYRVDNYDDDDDDDDDDDYEYNIVYTYDIVLGEGFFESLENFNSMLKNKKIKIIWEPK